LESKDWAKSLKIFSALYCDGSSLHTVRSIRLLFPSFFRVVLWCFFHHGSANVPNRFDVFCISVLTHDSWQKIMQRIMNKQFILLDFWMKNSVKYLQRKPALAWCLDIWIYMHIITRKTLKTLPYKWSINSNRLNFIAIFVTYTSQNSKK